MKREKYLWLTRYNLCRVEDSKDAVEQQSARKASMLNRDKW